MMTLKSRRRIWFALGWAPALLLAGGYMVSQEYYSVYGNPIKNIRVGEVWLKVEVVRTPEKIGRGLGGRSSLPEGRGMLFVMPKRDLQDFWMQGMRVALDIVWIDRDRIVGLESNISPDHPGILTSPSPVNLVLEVPGGFCARRGIKVGDQVVLKP